MIVHSHTYATSRDSPSAPPPFRGQVRMSSLHIGRFPAFFGLLAALGLLAGCGPKANPQDQQDQPAPEVTVVTLKPQAVTLTRELPGRATAFLTAEVRPQVDGIIARRLFT